MPVSTPSYFPPNRTGDQIIGINAGLHYVGARCFLAGQAAGNNSTVTDIIIIGDNSFSQAITDQSLIGTVSIGSQSLASLTTANDAGGALTAVGYNAGNALVFGASSVIIGDNAAEFTTGESGSLTQKNVIIGSGAARFIGGVGSENPFISASIVIGYLAGAGGTIPGGSGTIDECILIGSNCATNVVSGSGAGTLDGAIIIGCNTAENINVGAGESGGVVIIGSDCHGVVSPNYSVLIGTGSSIGGGTNCVAIGYSVSSMGNSYNVQVGDHSSAGTGSNNVIIGSNAGFFEPDPVRNLIIETGQNDIVGVNYRLVYGYFGPIGSAQPTGLIFGDSSNALANEDIQGRNTVKIVNGLIGSANPVGGGYFYVSAGALHWVGSSGTDTVLAGA